MQPVGIFFLVYGIIAVLHILIQMFFAHRNHRGQQRDRQRVGDSNLSVAVVVPVYNESPAMLNDCLASIVSQEGLRSLQVYAVNDGSKNWADIAPVLANYPQVYYFDMPTNMGKRAAQKVVFDLENTADIMVTVDSDTVLEDSLDIATALMRFEDPNVGAVCGDVSVINAKKNFLTRLIDLRYWMAFHQERAAQSHFASVLCASGPFSLYRSRIIRNIKDAYASQRFLGARCTYGDDRHLTNLVLQQGHDVVFEERARALTHAPETLPAYVKQQVRWNKSFYREMLWTARFMFERPWYMAYDLLCQLVLPFLLIIALVATIVQAFTGNPGALVFYVSAVLGIALLRVVYALGRTRRWDFLLFIFYGFMHVLVLIPVRLYALATMRQVRWGTR